LLDDFGLAHGHHLRLTDHFRKRHFPCKVADKPPNPPKIPLVISVTLVNSVIFTFLTEMTEVTELN
jgi:hypothetical protein